MVYVFNCSEQMDYKVSEIARRHADVRTVYVLILFVFGLMFSLAEIFTKDWLKQDHGMIF